MKFKDVDRLPESQWSAHMGFEFFFEWLKERKANLNPDFQRGHVWTLAQKTAYIEWISRGGEYGKHIYFNHPGWMGSFKGGLLLVDGKQRIKAVYDFLHDRVPAFNCLFSEFEDSDRWLRSIDSCFIVSIASLKTRAEVLKWYLVINSGGTPHSPQEIERVTKLLENEYIMERG